MLRFSDHSLRRAGTPSKSRAPRAQMDSDVRMASRPATRDSELVVESWPPEVLGQEHCQVRLRLTQVARVERAQDRFDQRPCRIVRRAVMGRLDADVYRPDAARADVYDELYAEYVQLHDYFGRGGNSVMHRLRAIRDRAYFSRTGSGA